MEHARGAGAGRGAWGPGRVALMTVPLRWLAVAPGTTPPKLESLSDWQPALISRETDAELVPGRFQRTPGGLPETSPKGV